MQDKLAKFKKAVLDNSNTPSFVHKPWFNKYHLEIVEKICLELLAIYPEADPDLTMALMWVHDYGTPIDFDNRKQATYEHGRSKMEEIGFEQEFVDKVIEYLEIFESKMTSDLHQAPIEVKIVSSADGMSHFIGPFMMVYWQENSDKSLEELMQANEIKAKKDWEHKIVLPEVKEFVNPRYKYLMEMSGHFPESFLSD